jgi:hypothetical protein
VTDGSFGGLRDWSEEDAWLDKVAGVLAEHEVLKTEVESLIPPDPGSLIRPPR